MIKSPPQDPNKGAFVFALPKGRVMVEAVPLLKKIGLPLPEDFLSNDRRRLITEIPLDGNLGEDMAALAKDFSVLKLVEVKNWDVFSFVASAAASAGIMGRDIWEEKLQGGDSNLDNIYVPIDLKIGKCRLSTARPRTATTARSVEQGAKKIVASKYPNISRQYYLKQNQAIDVIALSGSLELAPALGLADEIIDLVATGQTLKDNQLVEENKIMDVSSLLMFNRVAYKTYPLACAGLSAAFKNIL